MSGTFIVKLNKRNNWDLSISQCWINSWCRSLQFVERPITRVVLS